MMKKMLILIPILTSSLCFAQKKQEAKSGIIAKATAHSVTLSCTPPTGSNVTGYNFYKGTTAGGENPTPLNASPVSSCGYIDTAVAALQTYFYTAKAYCPTCSPNLSGPSNEAQAVIPGDVQPNPPTSLTASSQ